MRRVAILVIAALLAGCQVTTGPAPRPTGQTAGQQQTGPVPATRARARYQAVVERVMPVARSACERQTRRVNCSYRVIVDERLSSPPNAFQTLDQSGRPVIGFTINLLRGAKNADELAFILGHEAAHHIEGHIAQTRNSAALGGLVGNLAGSLLGAQQGTTDLLTRGGQMIGSRIYSKDHELEADRLGTIIAYRAGYNPVRGAQYFNRIPDPGDRFLGTHPPNANRLETVRQTAAGLR